MDGFVKTIKLTPAVLNNQLKSAVIPLCFWVGFSQVKK
jgi:hypothetical protein